MATRQQIAAELNRLEPDYRLFKTPEHQAAVKDRTFARVVKIFNSSVIRPENAPFAIGRMVEALDEYTSMLALVERYEKLEADLATIAKVEDARRKAEEAVDVIR